MLDIKFIRDNSELVKKNNADRGVKVDVDHLLKLDEDRRRVMQEVEELRRQRNQGSKTRPTEEEITHMREVGDQIGKLEEQLRVITVEYENSQGQIPNLTHPDAPRGGEINFKVLETHGKPPKFDFPAKDHEQLLTELDLIDFERGAKVAGNKFYFAKGDLVRLNSALIGYGIDIATKQGYQLLETPDLAKNELLTGIGYNPRGEAQDQIYIIENTGLSLIATAEITVGGYHADEVLDLSDAPKKYAAISHCFRKEAGAYGKTSKGLYRVHQFTKLELFVFCKPEDSEKLHQEILNIEKEIVDGLKLPYRVIEIPSGDLGGPAYRKYDIEAWMTMQNDPTSPAGGYGEITSTSNCTDYQARRLNIKYRDERGELAYVHTLNGTAVVTSRFPIAIIENYQTRKGSIEVPKSIRKYMGIKEIKKK